MEDLEFYDKNKERCLSFASPNFDDDDELFIEIENITEAKECANIWLPRADVVRLVNHLVNILAQR